MVILKTKFSLIKLLFSLQQTPENYSIFTSYAMSEHFLPMHNLGGYVCDMTGFLLRWISTRLVFVLYIEVMLTPVISLQIGLYTYHKKVINKLMMSVPNSFHSYYVINLCDQ